MYNNFDNKAHLVYCFEHNAEFLFLRFLARQVQLLWIIFVADTGGAVVIAPSQGTQAVHLHASQL